MQRVLWEAGPSKWKKMGVVSLLTVEESNKEMVEELLAGGDVMVGPATTEVTLEEAMDMDVAGNPPVMVPPPSLEEPLDACLRGATAL